MGRFSEDIARLSAEVAALRAGRREFADGLTRGNLGMKAAVARMRDAFDVERSRAAAEIGTRLEASVSGTRRAVAALKRGASGMRVGLRDAHCRMAEEARSGRMAFISGLRTDVARMRNGFRDARAEVSGRIRGDLTRFMTGVRRSAADMRAAVQGFRGMRQVEMSSAHQAWSSPQLYTRPVGRRVESRREGADKPAAGGIRTSQPTGGVGSRDDLQLISGIGPDIQRRLKRAGISSLAQLASATPARIQRALGKLGRLSAVDGWIEQARRLAPSS